MESEKPMEEKAYQNSSNASFPPPEAKRNDQFEKERADNGRPVCPCA